MERTVPEPRHTSGAASTPADDLRQALQAVDECLAQFATDAPSILQRAEAALARVRDHFIERIRLNEVAEDRAALHTSLGLLNICISLIWGVAYPQDAPKSEPLEQARTLILDLLKQEQPSDQR